MAKRTSLIAAVAIVVAACGSGEAADTTTSVVPPVSTTAASTTTAAPTTTGAPTTTVDAGSQEAGISPQLSSVRAALAQSAEIQSGRIEGAIEMTGVVDGTNRIDVSMPFAASFDAATGNSAFSMDLSAIAEAGGEEVPPELGDLFGEIEVRQVDGISYIKFPFFGMMFGAETPWVSAPVEEGEDLMSGFTFAQPGNPADIFGAFEEADAAAEDLGRETVNGLETTHYRVVFDTQKLIEEASAEELAELEASGPLPLTELPMDLWISDDGLVVRYVMDIDGSDVVSEGGDEFERMVIRYDLLDLNQPVEIVAPDPSEVTDLESLGSGLFGLTDEG